MTQAINTRTLNAAIVAALKVARSFGDRVADIRAALPSNVLADRDALTRALRPGVAKFHGVEWAEHGATGKFVGDETGAARQDLSRLCRAVMGQGPRQQAAEALDVPADIARLAAKLVKACGEYEEASRLLATAIAQAKAAAKA